MDIAEAAMKKKERAKKRAEAGETTVTNRIAKQIEAATGFESSNSCSRSYIKRRFALRL